MIGALAHVLDEERQQIGPLVAGQLDGGDGGDDLGGSIASTGVA